jgi:serine/threonine protein kinase
VEYKHFIKEKEKNQTDIFHIILEYMEGGSLKGFIKGANIPLEQVKEFGRQILDGL